METRDTPDGSALPRSMGLPGATSVGVGAIVGGGILALAGVAFATTGPSAILAFACNGLIALLTALSFAELATQFPESGGTYAYAKKVLSIEAAFAVGWVVWFASIVAGVLYAFGFGAFAALALDAVSVRLFSTDPGQLSGRPVSVGLAVAATLFYTIALTRQASSDGKWPNVAKILVFAFLVIAGGWALAGQPASRVRDHMTPFFSSGTIGLISAMGYTFIALQGFDLIAAVSGEIREPLRTIPRAMFLSLGIALGVYLPLLFVIATVGMAPGESVTQASIEHPEAIVAVAARRFLGSFGYWMVVVAALLSMLTALQANLLAASRIALAMARDRTLPRWFEARHTRFATPANALLATALIIITLVVLLPGMAAIGAASSLVFLATFALAHWIGVLARRRGGTTRPFFKTPFFPVVPALGATACVALGIFQAISVPAAGLIAMGWLVVGGILYLTLFARRARAYDAYARSLDAELVRLRGQTPLVLVPIANPRNAEAMVGLATALTIPSVGRVLLLSIVTPSNEDEPGDLHRSLDGVQAVLQEAMAASFARNLAPEALMTIARHPWLEIQRVARIHRCESLLIGLSSLTEPGVESRLEQLIAGAACDVVVLRAPEGWLLRDTRRVLVPIAGQGEHDELRARLLGSIHRLGAREVTLLRVLPSHAGVREVEFARRDLERIAHDEIPIQARVDVVRTDDVIEELCQRAAESDLVILGLRRLSGGRKAFGDVALRIARDASCGIVMISRR